VNRSASGAATTKVAEPAALASLIREIVEKRFDGNQSAALKAVNRSIEELKRRERKVFVEPISQPTFNRLIRGRHAAINSNTELWLRIFMRLGDRLLLMSTILGGERLADLERQALETSISGMKQRISRALGRLNRSEEFGSEELEKRPHVSDEIRIAISQANLDEETRNSAAARGLTSRQSVFGPGVLGDQALTPREILRRERERRRIKLVTDSAGTHQATPKL
jgi:hypothetical protein